MTAFKVGLICSFLLVDPCHMSCNHIIQKPMPPKKVLKRPNFHHTNSKSRSSQATTSSSSSAIPSVRQSTRITSPPNGAAASTTTSGQPLPDIPVQYQLRSRAAHRQVHGNKAEEVAGRANSRFNMGDMLRQVSSISHQGSREQSTLSLDHSPTQPRASEPHGFDFETHSYDGHSDFEGDGGYGLPWLESDHASCVAGLRNREHRKPQEVLDLSTLT